jgi:hypothetical protein
MKAMIPTRKFKTQKPRTVVTAVPTPAVVTLVVAIPEAVAATPAVVTQVVAIREAATPAAVEDPVGGKTMAGGMQGMMKGSGN